MTIRPLILLAATASMGMPGLPAAESPRGSTVLPAITYLSLEDHVYQYRIPEDPQDPNNKTGSYLWLPPDCTRVNGLLLAPKNMAEQPFFESAALRSVCREMGMGIIMLGIGRKSPCVVDAFPDVYPDKGKSGQKIFNYKQGAVEYLQRLLDRMAAATGYAELAQAPLIPLGHSWAGAFPSQLTYGMPERTICVIPLKIGGLGGAPPFDPSSKPNLDGTPVLMVDEQYGPNLTSSVGWDHWEYRRGQARMIRQRPGDPAGNPVSRAILLGVGHCEMPPALLTLMADYVRDICRLRLPAPGDGNGSPCLKAIDMTTGWLVDDRLELPADQCAATAPWSAYTGNRANAIWYPGERTARACEAAFRGNFHGRKPQSQAFITGPGQTVSREGFGRLTISALDDDQTFTVRAEAQTTTTSPWWRATTCGSPPSRRARPTPSRSRSAPTSGVARATGRCGGQGRSSAPSASPARRGPRFRSCGRLPCPRVRPLPPPHRHPVLVVGQCSRTGQRYPPR